MKLLAVLFAMMLSLANMSAAADEERYPQEALQCYSSAALQSQKDGKIICPPGTEVCIKEVVNATSRTDCGSIEGIHYGRDVWDIKLAQCVYRKCGNTCPSSDADRARTFGGDGELEQGDIASSKLLEKLPTPVFNRTSYCCDTNLCNGAFSFGVGTSLVTCIVFAASLVAF